jgi:hypothetical protein
MDSICSGITNAWKDFGRNTIATGQAFAPAGWIGFPLIGRYSFTGIQIVFSPYTHRQGIPATKQYLCNLLQISV